MMTTDDLDENGSDICRVCRTEATSDKPLYHPCLCTGSIKFVHQDCLTQWLKYSRKEFCELCNHKYTFMPIYHPDMPKRLPVREFLWGLVSNLARAVRFWFHYTLVAVAWLGVVPLTACRIYRCLFRGSVNSLLTLPLDMLSTDNLVGDCLQGAFIIILTLCAFVSLVWLREQIIHGGPPQWLNLDINMNGNNNNRQQQQQQPPVAHAEAVDHNAAVAALAAAVAEGQEVDENAPVADEAQQQPPPPVPPPPVENFPQNNNQQEAAQDDNNWQPFEWDRAAEELTWERLLGLDGSLVFLEHVFWVISLNTLFIVVFAFSPFHVGHFVVASLKLTPYVQAMCFEGLMTTLIGYFIIGFVLYVLHTTCRMFKFKR